MTREDFWQGCSDVTDYWQNLMPMNTCEEAGELVQAISKMEREIKCKCRKEKIRDLKEELSKEIADMYISLRALMFYYGIEEDTIDRLAEKKLSKVY